MRTAAFVAFVSSVVAASSVLVLACSVLYSPSIDEFSSGGVSTSDDASLDRNASGSSSSSGDGSLSPSATLPDGAPAPFTCPANALICDDFERANVGGVFLKSSGPVALSMTKAHSPNRSLSATVQQGRDMPYVESTITAPARITTSFWFYAEAEPPAYRSRIAHILIGPPCDWDLTWQMGLDRDGLKMATETYDNGANPNCGSVDGKSHTPLTSAQVYVPKWHHVTVKIDVTQQTRRTEVQVDDLPVVIDDVTSKRTSVPTQLTLGVGILCVQTNGGCFEWDREPFPVFIDDVILAPTAN